MFERPLLAPFDECANRGWCGVESIDSMAFDDVPEPIRLRPVRRAFIHQRGRAVRQWAINNIAVPGHPTDVRRAPINVLILEIENPLRRQMSLQEIAASRVQNAFRLSRRS